MLKVVVSLTAYCASEIRAVNLTHKIPEAVQRALLADSPDIVIATPARAAFNVNNAALSLDRLEHLVVDEADLVLSFGYDEDLRNVAKASPKGVQTFLMSATLSSELDTVKKLFCRDPVVIELEEKEDDSGGQLSQFVVRWVCDHSGRKPKVILHKKTKSVFLKVCGRRKVPVDLCHLQVEAGPGEMHRLRRRY